MSTPRKSAFHRLADRPNRTPVRPCGVFLSVCLLFLTACSTTGPRVLEVTNRTCLQDVDKADQEYFVKDRASLIRYEPRDLSVADQREEFYVRWTPGPASRPDFRPISLVKFEYRQVAKPAQVFEQTYTPDGDERHLFEVRGEQFRAGGVISAWRVSLWDGDKVLAEEKSVLW